MNSGSNKLIIQDIFEALAEGNDGPFIDAMADDFQWTWMGSGALDKSFIGKKTFLEELWQAVRTTLIPPFIVKAQNIIADDHCVVIEAIGENKTPDGKIYNNKYCWVCLMKDGKIHKLREYMDTALVIRTFN